MPPATYRCTSGWLLCSAGWPQHSLLCCCWPCAGSAHCIQAQELLASVSNGAGKAEGEAEAELFSPGGTRVLVVKDEDGPPHGDHPMEEEEEEDDDDEDADAEEEHRRQQLGTVAARGIQHRAGSLQRRFGLARMSSSAATGRAFSEKGRGCRIRWGRQLQPWRQPSMSEQSCSG